MEIKELFKDLYAIDNGCVKAFLIVSDNDAILIDTLFKEDDILKEVQNITDKPVKVLLTHGHHDHCGGVIYFGECHMHKNDFSKLNDDIIKHPLSENDHFRCGEYDLRVIEIPGHTKGSVAFFDQDKGLLIAGDTVQKDGPIYMIDGDYDIDAYIESLKKLMLIKDQIKVIVSSHHDCLIDASYIEKDLCDALAFKENKLPRSKGERFDIYIGKYTSFYH